MKRHIWSATGRSFVCWYWITFQPSGQLGDRTFQLGIMTVKGQERIIVDNNVRLDSRHFNSTTPTQLVIENSPLRCRSKTIIDQDVARWTPNTTTPRTGTNHFPNPKFGYTPCDTFTITRGKFVHQYYHFTPKGKLFIPIQFTISYIPRSWCPIHKGLTLQGRQYPGIDITTHIVSNI